MEDIEKKIDPLFKELIERAMTNDSKPFEFICCLQERAAVKAYIRATKKVVSLFKNLETQAGLSYASLIMEGKQQSEVLLAYLQFKRCKQFYEKELFTLKDMLSEYRAYVFGGHLASTLLGFYRKDFDKVDYRKLPWKLF